MKSICIYIHARRYPVDPGILGKILLFMAITILEVSKIFLITSTLLYDIYLHPFVYALQFSCVYTYLNCSYGSFWKIGEDAYKMMLIPTFYTLSLPRKASRTTSTFIQNKVYPAFEKVVGPMLLQILGF